MRKIKKIINLAYQQNKNGRIFPIWGTCLGFEAMILSFSDYKLKTVHINTENTNKKIIWDNTNFKNSMFNEVLRPEIS
jgi:hypothetical protein